MCHSSSWSRVDSKIQTRPKVSITHTLKNLSLRRMTS